MAILEVQDLEKSFGGLKVLRGVSFSLEKGQVLAIIGSSGSGKTTLLRCLNFLEIPDAGRITAAGETLFDGSDPSHFSEEAVRSKRLHFGMVFQGFNLFPQYTVLRNVTLAPSLNRRGPGAEIEGEAKGLLERMGLGDKLNAYPYQLSGGQQQRVAIARTLALNPDTILLDEPMSALDVATRLTMREELKNLQKVFGTTMIYVTHDQEEAFALSDRIMIMDSGAISQLDTPENIVNAPANEYVRSFVLDNLQMKIDSLSRFTNRRTP